MDILNFILFLMAPLDRSVIHPLSYYLLSFHHPFHQNPHQLVKPFPIIVIAEQIVIIMAITTTRLTI